MVRCDNWLAQTPSKNLGNIPQHYRGMDMNNVRITLPNQITNRHKREKGDAQPFVGRPFKRRKAIDPHLVLKTTLIVRSITWCNYPDLMASFCEIEGQASGHGRHTTYHWWILICNNHNPHNNQ